MGKDESNARLGYHLRGAGAGGSDRHDAGVAAAGGGAVITIDEARSLMWLWVHGSGYVRYRANELLCVFINQYEDRTAVIEWLMAEWQAVTKFTK